MDANRKAMAIYMIRGSQMSKETAKKINAMMLSTRAVDMKCLVIKNYRYIN